MGIKGFILNTGGGVLTELEGTRANLNRFLERLLGEKPKNALIYCMETTWLDPVSYEGFEIRQSETSEKKAWILPDIAMCAACREELLNPKDRRYQYPFINCTHCGPRFSVIRDLPYDRCNTSMSAFPLCDQCLDEYKNPGDRRFHAQATACPRCGPHIEFWDRQGNCLSKEQAALCDASQAIENGKIVAMKGLGGFQLLAIASSVHAVELLRERKHREEKPFAVMFPDFDQVTKACECSGEEKRLLESAASPIVLLKKHSTKSARGIQASETVVPQVAPGNPYLGVMLPYTPLHLLLMKLLGCPVIATSGNLSDEPICIDEQEALQRLDNIADYFLVHNRPIVRQVDDSIARIVGGREMILRRARGYAPFPVGDKSISPGILAVGAHLKNTIAISMKEQAFLSQHIGDLETVEAYQAFERINLDFRRLYDRQPQIIACDLHPNYLSTQYAQNFLENESRQQRTSENSNSEITLLSSTSNSEPIGQTSHRIQIKSVQHHHAHLGACMAENALSPPVLGVVWDGTGWGSDGMVWGGEFFGVTQTHFRRMATLRPFHLPGGDKAVREPRRSALGLLYEIFGDSAFEMEHLETLKAFDRNEITILRSLLRQGVQSPLTTSAGRLFDAISSLLNIRHVTHFEGQAAMELEFACEGFDSEKFYGMQIVQSNRNSELIQNEENTSASLISPTLEKNNKIPRAVLMLDWERMVWGILEDIRRGVSTGIIAARYHNTLVETIIEVAKFVGEEKVVLTGGCFQNRYLTERAIKRLIIEGFRPYWHQRVPPNDGGIALGQVWVASQTGLAD